MTKRPNGESIVATLDEKRPKMVQENENSNGSHPQPQDLLGGTILPTNNGDQVIRCPICLWPVNSPQCYHINAKH